jgi:hypothetical protein
MVRTGSQVEASNLVEGEHPMIGASKILTVSYGTFSCTLEGFDDPFNTMRAIAEYFRDLAAEDRYFGAEPPTPDAAMLHRIAEREVQRRVDAKIQENGVVLRAMDAGEHPAPAPKPAPPPAPSVAAASVTGSESVAEKLSRLRSEVAQHAEPAVTATAASFAMPEYLEDQEPAPAAMAEAGLADLLPETEPAAASDALPDVDMLPEEASAEDVEDLLPETEAASAAIATTEETAEGSSDIAADDALLASLGGLLGTAEVAEDETEAEAEEQSAFVAEDEVAEVAEVTAALAETVTEDDVAAMATPAEPETAQAPETPVEVAAETTHEDKAEPLTASAEDEEFDEDLAPETLSAATETTTTSDFDEDAEEEEEEDETTAGPAKTIVPPLVPEPQFTPRPGALEKLTRARARVIKIRGLEPESAAETEQPSAAPATSTPDAMSVIDLNADAGQTPDIESSDDLAEPAQPEIASESPLAPEVEADLERELAALRAEEELDRQIAALANHEGVKPETDNRRHFDDATGDDAVSRLMAQADSAMEGEETKRRQSAIAHLKAAVAATVAERRATAGQPVQTKEPSRIARYRDDLAMVVRGRLPGSQKPSQGERPAPLVLVSEQRIDRPRPVAVPTPGASATQPAAAISPVRPRRVTGSGLAMQTREDDDLDEDFEDDAALESASAFVESKSFADFIERIGARSLAEVMEASAAYMACVEGRSQFTRPQLMRQLTKFAPTSDLQREDGLRSFGTLLRNGRIEKVKRGQFAVSDASPYLKEAKRFAG